MSRYRDPERPGALPDSLVSPDAEIGPKRSKYGVRTDAIGKAARTWRGVPYRSLLEYRCARRLDLMVGQGASFSWDPTPEPWPLIVNGAKVGTYRPDFEVVWRSGDAYSEPEWIETKGVRVRDWVLRENVVRALYPERRLVVVRSVSDLEKWWLWSRSRSRQTIAGT